MSTFVSQIMTTYRNALSSIFDSSNTAILLTIIVVFAIICFFNFIFRERR